MKPDLRHAAAPPAAPDAGERDPTSAVSVVAIAAMCMGLGASLGFTPGFIATALRDDLDISRGEVGLLVSLYFGCTGVGSIMGGRMTDRFGARAVVVLDMAAVAAAAVLSAAVGTYWSLLVAAVIGGTAYALVNAGTNVAIARSVPQRRRTLAMSIKTAGVPLMAAIAAALGPVSANRWSWQHISAAIAVFAVVGGVGAALVLADDRPDRRDTQPSKQLPAGFVWFPIGAFLLIAGSQPLYSWVVPYLEQSLDASPGVAGGISSAASAAGVGVMVLNGLRTDRIGAELRVRRIIVLLAINVVATAMVLAGDAIGIALVAVGTIVGISVQLSAIGTMHATIVDRAPGAVARATGWTMTGYYLGALFSPAAFGALADLTDTFAYSWAATIVLLLLAIPAWATAGKVTIVDDQP